MDFLLALTLGLWAFGGIVSSVWVFWLDRERSEFGGPTKVAVLFGWPVLLPTLLWRREDIGAFVAVRVGAFASLLLALGPAISWVGALDDRRPPRAVPVPIRQPLVREPPRRVNPSPPYEFIARMEINADDRRRAQAHWNAGIVFFQKGDYARAREEWLACRQADPGNSDCSTGLSRVDLALAGQVATPLPTESSKREAVRYWNSGIIFYQKGDFERAAEEWKTCSRLDPANGECATGLKRIAQSYGQP